jgi:YesN/AraC family two-component response regulator
VACSYFDCVTKSAGQETQKRLSVVVADDSAAIRHSLSALISRLENVEIVGMAQTGAEALEMVRGLKPDVLTLDMRMPELSGIKVLEAIKRDGLEVMVIVLTGLEEPEYRRKCMDLGAKHFFHKATEFELLIELLGDQSRHPEAGA